MGWVGVAAVGALIGSIVTHLVDRRLPGMLARRSPAGAVAVHVETDPTYAFAGMPDWVGCVMVASPGRLATLGAPPDRPCTRMRTWGLERGLADGGSSYFWITLQGRVDVPVVIDGIRPIVCSSVDAEDTDGVALWCAVGGGELGTVDWTIDLDFEVAVPADSGTPRSLTLRKGESVRLAVTAETQHFVEWTAEVLLIVDGARRVIKVDCNGEPFRTCGTKGRQCYEWNGGEWERNDFYESLGQ